MIVSLPLEMPDPHAPFVVLLGSAGSWQASVARELDRSFVGVCRSDGPQVMPVAPMRWSYQPNPLHLAAVLHELLLVASAVVVWLDDQPCWPLLEIGRQIEARPAVMVVGVAPDPTWCWAGSVKYHAQTRGLRVWTTIEETVAAARQLGRQERGR